ncbi:MAG TPA: hypothetical protein PKE62_08550 [Anaerolineales bacterium]|nr:hypothetical protein [Anaerolineales bacterium]
MPITENQLDEWSISNAREAQGLIVELVWHLVAASCPKPRDRRFPLPDSIGQHGPDGILDVTLPFEPFVPDGLSYWEIGTGSDAKRKATDDYRGLTEAVPESVRHETTFVFVTPRSGRKDWEYSWKEDAQADWLHERRSMGDWKDIRIIDGTKLVEWLKLFPAVDLWLTQKVGGIPISQVEILSQHWGLLSSIGEPPPLNTELFLINREDSGSKLKEVLDGTLNQLKLTTHYVDQVVDFVAAYLASLDVETQAEALGRCLIVSGVEGWNSICNNTHWKNQILVADASLDLSGDSGTKLIQKARKAGHAIIFGGPHGGIPDPTSIPLRTPNSFDIQKALEKAGYSEERARALSQKSGGNLSSLLRCIQNLSVMPEWAEKSNAAELAIAVLLGSWNEGSEADRTVVEKLSGKAYGEWIKGMRDVALRPSTPLIHQDGHWKFVPRYEGWYALGPNLFDEHLDRLREEAVSLFRLKDPKFELPPEKRYAAGMYGKASPYSRIIRNGLAETLSLIGSHPKALKSCSLGKAEAIAVIAVREILDAADWIQWASVNDYLPLLAEAAPGEFLKAVEDTLQRQPCPFDEIFGEEGKGGILLSSNYMTGLLWALETLAWDPDYLSRATILLGELASRDPGGQSGNRPASSLATIFLPWFPQTTASLTKRVSAVKTLLTEIPDVGWKLLVSLLPQHHSFSSGTRRPAWRATIPDDWRRGVTHAEYFEQITAYSELAINEAKKDISKLTTLIENMETLPQPALEQMLAYLGSDSITSLPEEENLSLWNKLLDLIKKHRRFPQAEWAMPADLVTRIATLTERLAPVTPFYQHQRIFKDHYYDLFDADGDYEAQMKELEKRRQTAIEEIIAGGGSQLVLEFAQAVQSARAVGISFGAIAKSDDEDLVLPSLLMSESNSLAGFAGGFVWGRYWNKGWKWVDNLRVSKWTSEQIGRFFVYLPFMEDTWRRVDAFLGEDQSYYWRNASANPYEAKVNLNFAIEKLIQYDRPNAAVQCLHRVLYEKNPIDNGLAIRALLRAVNSTELPNQTDVYDSIEVIKSLQNNSETDPNDLFRVEWAYLPVLDGHHGATPKLLWKRLAEDPSFFSEVIRVVFRSKDHNETTEEITEDRRNIATNAYRLLSEWRRPPGMLDDGSYDASALNLWLDAVRKECTDSGHLEIALSRIGHVLRYAPADPDGLWIHRSAAAILNKKDSQEMRSGFRTELYNSRGVHFVDPNGKPERELADKYRQQAETAESAGYPRLADTLRELATEYDREAERISSRNLFED